MVLTFQLNKEKDSLEILFDEEGHELFSRFINKKWEDPIPKENGLFDLDHEHLMSKDWGGNELTTEFTSKGKQMIHAVKIVYLGKEGESLLL